jgi:hypothetical protein
MNRYQVVGSESLKNCIKLTIQIGPHLGMERFTAIRGGLAWPTNESPFYYSIVGQVYDDLRHIKPAFPYFQLLVERTVEGLDLEGKFNQLLDDGNLYFCEFYADLGTIHEDEIDSYSDFHRSHRSPYGNLTTAPYVDNFRLGVELLKGLIKSKRLDIPKETVAFEQLSRITESDLADPAIASRFYAIEALRHVMASFKRDPVIQTDFYRTPGGAYGGDQGWMM